MPEHGEVFLKDDARFQEAESSLVAEIEGGNILLSQVGNSRV
jgi:hypothetical protein